MIETKQPQRRVNRLKTDVKRLQGVTKPPEKYVIDYKVTLYDYRNAKRR